MRLRFCRELGAAEWITRSATPFPQLVTFGPAGFEAYARLRFIPDPDRPGQAEADAVVPDDHPSDLAQASRALHRLAAFTSTPEDCYFCVWDGYSDIPLPPGLPLIDLPHRSYALLRGPLDAVDAWADELGGGLPVAPPAYAWPADRRWCLTSDVDPHWAGIGAQRAAVEALLADPELDVVPARPDEDQPAYY